MQTNDVFSLLAGHEQETYVQACGVSLEISKSINLSVCLNTLLEWDLSAQTLTRSSPRFLIAAYGSYYIETEQC